MVTLAEAIAAAASVSPTEARASKASRNPRAKTGTRRHGPQDASAGHSRGRAARAHGEALESALDRQHDAYRAAGLADVRKVPTPVQVMGPTRRDARGRTTFPATFAARASCDFEGVLADGRAVRIEAKHREGDRLRLADVQPQQVDALRWAHDHGAVALLVVRLGGECWCVPAACLWAEGPKTWTARDMDARGIRLTGLDWMPAMRYYVRQVGA